MQVALRRSGREVLEERMRGLGYDANETRSMLDTIDALRAGRGMLTLKVLEACIRMGGSRYREDVWRMMESWNRACMTSSSTKELSQEQAALVAGAAKGPSEPAPVPPIAFLPIPGGGFIGSREIGILYDIYRALSKEGRKPTPRHPMAVPLRRRLEPSEDWHA